MVTQPAGIASADWILLKRLLKNQDLIWIRDGDIKNSQTRVWFAETSIGQSRVVKAIRVLDQEFEWLKTLSKLNLSGTPLILAIEKGQEHHFIVETYIKGRHATDFITTATWHEKCCVAARVCAILNRCHQNGVLHLDIKPDHLIIDAFNEPYLIDFGTSRPSNPVKRLSSRQVFSTPAYAAPECFSGQDRIGCKSDTYSLALIFLDWLSHYAISDSQLYKTLLMATHFHPEYRFSDLKQLEHLFLNEVYGT